MEWLVKWSKWPKWKLPWPQGRKGCPAIRFAPQGLNRRPTANLCISLKLRINIGHLKIRSSHVFLISYLNYIHHFRRSNGQVVCNFAESGLQYNMFIFVHVFGRCRLVENSMTTEWTRCKRLRRLDEKAIPFGHIGDFFNIEKSRLVYLLLTKFGFQTLKCFAKNIADHYYEVRLCWKPFLYVRFC